MVRSVHGRIQRLAGVQASETEVWLEVFASSKALKEHPLLIEPYICSFFCNEIPRPKVGHGRWMQKQRREHGVLRGLLCSERCRVKEAVSGPRFIP